VHIRAGRTLSEARASGLVVAWGVSGFGSIDALLSSGAPQVSLVVDPVEAALVVSSARRTGRWLARAGVSPSALDALAAAAEPVALRSRDGVNFELDVFRPIALPGLGDARTHAEGRRQRVLIIFADGEELMVDAQRRFDRLERLGTTVSIPAAALAPGDAVVLCQDTVNFSERLMDALDGSTFREQAEMRRTWVSMVDALVKAQSLSKREIHRRLAALGVRVDYQTVRAWTSPSKEEDRVPARWEHFRNLAEAVGCMLPETELLGLFDAIRALRVRHRKAGRDLVRILRAARTGRVDPVSLRRIEALFGISVRELVEATRIAIVDDVLVEG
jgi:hypothetical protein